MKHRLLLAAVFMTTYAANAFALMGDDCIYDLPRCTTAGEAGDLGAQKTLAYLYSDASSGKTVPRDAQKEAYWLQKAADQGDTPSKLFLGDMYADGRGVKKDLLVAIRLFSEAASHAYPLALQSLTSTEIGLATMYHYGTDGLPKDDKKALDWMTKASEGSPEGGSSFALATVGQMYYEGDGVEKDVGKGVGFVRRAAEQGYDGAQLTLGRMFASGRYAPALPQDKEQAYLWLSLAASNNGPHKPDALKSLLLLESIMSPDEIATAKRRFPDWSKTQTPHKQPQSSFF